MQLTIIGIDTANPLEVYSPDERMHHDHLERLNVFLNTLTTDVKPSLYSLAKSIASSGFSDTSRVGGGNPELGVSMAKFNKKNIERHLASYRHSLNLFEKYLLEENWSELEKMLVNTQEERQNFISKPTN